MILSDADGRFETQNAAVIGIWFCAAKDGGVGSSIVLRWPCRYVSSVWRFTTCKHTHTHTHTKLAG